jgi:hypothetical protein
MAFYATLSNSNDNTTVVGGKSIPSGGSVSVTLEEYFKMSRLVDPTSIAGVSVTFLKTFHAGQIPSTQATDAEVAEAIAALSASLNLGVIEPVDGAQSTLAHEPGVDGNDKVTFTAVEYGTVGDDITITIVDPGEESSASISVDGTDIVITLESSDSPAILTTAADIVSLIEGDDDAAALVTAVAEGNGEGLTAALAKTALSGGVDVAPDAIVGSYGYNAAGNLMYIRVDEQTWKKATLAGL